MTHQGNLFAPKPQDNCRTCRSRGYLPIYVDGQAVGKESCPWCSDTKPEPSGEGKYCVAYQHNGRWWGISRDHRFMTMDQAATWLVSQQYLYSSELEVVLVDEINR